MTVSLCSSRRSLLFTLLICCCAVKLSAAPPEPEQAFFRQEVVPLLAQRCFKCHGGKQVQGGLRLNNRPGVLKGGESGPSVNLEHFQEGLLWNAVNYQELEMPPAGKLPAKEIAILRRWLSKGLAWDQDAIDAASVQTDSPPVDALARQFWSFQPVQRPALPAVTLEPWSGNPIDRFILAQLESAGLTPAPPADPATLLRRIYYDLTGLPPSPEQVRRFLAAPSAKAYEKVIDELLASEHYGERWARHWLDLVRYAESNSYERDGPKPNVWRFRDYVIRAFNQDMPYDQFILEQLAGDELPDRTADQLIATGYHRLGIWQDEPVDRKQELYEDIDDLVRTTSEVFLGLRIGCARCHDHKLDPVPQRDYYRFAAFFSGINRYGIRGADTVARFSLRDIASDEQRKQQQAAIAAHEKQVQQVNQQISDLEKLVYDDFSEVEKENFRDEGLKIQIVKRRTGKKITKEQFEQYSDYKAQQKKLKRFKPPALDQALCITEIGNQPRQMHVLMRGNAHAPGDAVEPGFPEVLSFEDPTIPATGKDAKTSGRRLELARWITRKDNPLTARVMANRIWQHHFGRGLVRSPNDFGYSGSRPTHPQLLDWLASELVAGNWHLKRLHKLILLSQTYQMSSQDNPAHRAQDPANHLLWRFEMRRLSAEEIRDTILSVAGNLNRKKYGPSIFPRIDQEVLAGQSVPGSHWRPSTPEEQSRRSIYIHTKRSLVVPLIAAFDGAETDNSCPIRFSTTQPTQALATLNGQFLNSQATTFAEALRKQGKPTEDQVQLALWRGLQRPPQASEVQRGVQLLETLTRHYEITTDKALEYFCLLVLNMNEFVYLD